MIKKQDDNILQLELRLNEIHNLLTSGEEIDSLALSILEKELTLFSTTLSGEDILEDKKKMVMYGLTLWLGFVLLIINIPLNNFILSFIGGIFYAGSTYKFINIGNKIQAMKKNNERLLELKRRVNNYKENIRTRIRNIMLRKVNTYTGQQREDIYEIIQNLEDNIISLEDISEDLKAKIIVILKDSLGIDDNNLNILIAQLREKNRQNKRKLNLVL